MGLFRLSTIDGLPYEMYLRQSLVFVPLLALILKQCLGMIKSLRKDQNGVEKNSNFRLVWLIPNILMLRKVRLFRATFIWYLWSEEKIDSKDEPINVYQSKTLDRTEFWNSTNFKIHSLLNSEKKNKQAKVSLWIWELQFLTFDIGTNMTTIVAIWKIT